MGELYARLKTNLINLIFFRNIVKDNEALQNTSRDHAKELRNCQHCYFPQIKLFSEIFLVLSIRNLKDFQDACHCSEEAVVGEDSGGL